MQTCLYWRHIVEMTNFSCLAPILSLKISTQGPKSDFLSGIQTLFTLVDTMHEKWDFDGVICRNIMTVPLVSGTFWTIEEKRKKVLSYYLLPTTLNGCFYTCARNCDQYLDPSISVHMLQVCHFHRLGDIMYVKDCRPGYVVTGLFGPRNVHKEYNANCKPRCWARQYKMTENHSIQYKLRGNHSICAKGMATIRYAFTIFGSWIKGHWANIRTTCYVNIIVCKSHFWESKWISSCEFRNNRPKRPLFAQFWLVLALFRLFCKRQKFSEKNGKRCGLKN